MFNQKLEQECPKAGSIGTPERRNVGFDRRNSKDRRSEKERRLDYRLSSDTTMRLINSWFHMIIRPRLGVDRRKGNDRRRDGDRRQQRLNSILSKEELSDLLS